MKKKIIAVLIFVIAVTISAFFICACADEPETPVYTYDPDDGNDEKQTETPDNATDDTTNDNTDNPTDGKPDKAPSVKPHVHSATHVGEISAKCTEGGNIEYWYCADCGKYYKDEELKNEITEAQTKTAATNHTPVTDSGKGATCEEDGLTDGSHCGVCGEVLSAQEKIDKTGHNYVNGICRNCDGRKASEGLEFAEAGANGVQIVSIGNCTDTHIVIPEKHEGQNVIKIGEGAFNGNEDIEYVYIGGKITEIGDRAFESCTHLKEVEIDAPIETIGESAFSETVITRIKLPQGLKTIGEGAFIGCPYLTTIEIPGSVETIGCDAFSWCNALTIITYGGTAEQWEQLKENLEGIENCTVICKDE